MRKPDSVCRVCLRAPTNPHFDDLCSSECATRLSQTEYYEIELEEAIAELNEFEEGVYLRGAEVVWGQKYGWRLTHKYERARQSAPHECHVIPEQAAHLLANPVSQQAHTAPSDGKRIPLSEA